MEILHTVHNLHSSSSSNHSAGLHQLAYQHQLTSICTGSNNRAHIGLDEPIMTIHRRLLATSYVYVHRQHPTWHCKSGDDSNQRLLQAAITSHSVLAGVVTSSQQQPQHTWQEGIMADMGFDWNRKLTMHPLWQPHGALRERDSNYPQMTLWNKPAPSNHTRGNPSMQEVKNLTIVPFELHGNPTGLTHVHHHNTNKLLATTTTHRIQGHSCSGAQLRWCVCRWKWKTSNVQSLGFHGNCIPAM